MDKKTKQVQVRLTPELHSKLKGTLALDGRKLVNFLMKQLMLIWLIASNTKTPFLKL